MAPLAWDIRARPAHIEVDIAALDPAEVGEPLPKCLKPRLRLRVDLGIGHQHADAPHPPVLLRPGRQRRSRCHAAEEGDE